MTDSYLGWYVDVPPQQRPDDVRADFEAFRVTEAWLAHAQAKASSFEAALAKERATDPALIGPGRLSVAVGVVVDREDSRFLLIGTHGLGDLPVALRSMIDATDVEAEDPTFRHAEERLLLHMHRIAANPKNQERGFRLESVVADFDSCAGECRRLLERQNVLCRDTDRTTPAAPPPVRPSWRLEAARGPLVDRILAAPEKIQRAISQVALERSMALMALEDDGVILAAIHDGEFGDTPSRATALNLARAYHAVQEQWRLWLASRDRKDATPTEEDLHQYTTAYRIAHSAWAGYFALDTSAATAAIEATYHARKVATATEVESQVKSILSVRTT